MALPWGLFASRNEDLGGCRGEDARIASGKVKRLQTQLTRVATGAPNASMNTGTDKPIFVTQGQCSRFMVSRNAGLRMTTRKPHGMKWKIALFVMLTAASSASFAALGWRNYPQGYNARGAKAAEQERKRQRDLVTGHTEQQQAADAKAANAVALEKARAASPWPDLPLPNPACRIVEGKLYNPSLSALWVDAVSGTVSNGSGLFVIQKGNQVLRCEVYRWVMRTTTLGGVERVGTEKVKEILVRNHPLYDSLKVSVVSPSSHGLGMKSFLAMRASNWTNADGVVFDVWDCGVEDTTANRTLLIPPTTKVKRENLSP